MSRKDPAAVSRPEPTAADRWAQLDPLLTALSEATAEADVASVVVEHIPRILQARGCSLLMLSEDGETIRSVHHARMPAALERCWQPYNALTQPPLRQALQRQPVWSTLADSDAGPTDLLSLPLLDGGQVLAMACVVAPAVRHSDEALLRLGRLCGMALHRARLHSSEQADHLRRLEDVHRQLHGVVGHDLRNPLAALMISAGVMLRSKDLGERQRETLQRVLASASRMKAMLGDLLDYTQMMVGGGITLVPVEHDLAASVRRVLVEAGRAEPERVVNAALPEKLGVVGDQERLEQVVQVLLSNALQHGAKDTPVTVQLDGEGDAAVLRVHNRGAPIAADALPTLFAPQRRGRRNGTRALGFGLFLARELARQHRGDLTVHSGDDGTTFTLRVPR